MQSVHYTKVTNDFFVHSFHFGKQYCSFINGAIFILCIAVILLDLFSPSTTGGGNMLPYPTHLRSRNVEVAY